ncbi:terminase small subunit, partial [Vibrio phage 1.115.B._10N.222.49.B11]
SGLTKREEAFCQNIAKYGEKEKVKAYTDAGYSTNMSNAAIHVQADKLFNKPKLSLRIKELRSKVMEKVEERFTISVEWRLQKLQEIIDAGLSKYKDGNGQARREGLSAAKGAIETINSMLGTGGEDEDKGEKLNITFNVSEPVRDVKVTRGE